jgi:hypothetical protein
MIFFIMLRKKHRHWLRNECIFKHLMTQYWHQNDIKNSCWTINILVRRCESMLICFSCLLFPQNNVTSTPPSPTSAPTSGPTAMGVSTTIPPGARSSSPCSATSGPPNSRCCDTGRPIFTDPISGQTICSCQYDLISYQRLASAGIAAAGPGGMPLSMYSAPYPEGMAAYFPALGADQAPFYPNPVSELYVSKKNQPAS